MSLPPPTQPTDDDLIALTDAYINGTATDAELTTLNSILDRGGEAAARVGARINHATLVQGWFAAEPDETFADRVLAAAEIAKKDSTFLKSVMATVEATSARPRSARVRREPTHREAPAPTSILYGRRKLMLTAAASLVIGLTVFYALQPEPAGSMHTVPQPVARIEAISGRMTLHRSDQQTSASPSQLLVEGEVLELAEGASAIVAQTDGTRLEFGSKSRAAVTAAGVSLHEGWLQATVTKRPAGAPPYLVTTRHCKVRVLGTRFTVETGDRSRVHVTEGVVAVSKADESDTIRVAAGQSVDVGSSGALAVQDVPRVVPSQRPVRVLLLDQDTANHPGKSVIVPFNNDDRTRNGFRIKTALESRGAVVSHVGHSVVRDASAEQIKALWQDKDLIVVTWAGGRDPRVSTGRSRPANEKLRDVPIPVILTRDPALGSAYGFFTGDTRYNEFMETKAVDIVNPAHPLAAGLTGTVIFSEPHTALFHRDRSALGPGAIIIASNNYALGPKALAFRDAPPTPAEPYHVLWCYEKGAIMADGQPAPARRCTTLVPKPDKPGGDSDAAMKLFYASIDWALEGRSPP